MTRDNDDRVLVICGYLSVLAAATIVLSMQVPSTDDTLMSMIGGVRFVVAVAAAIFGFIAWFERRFPLDDITIDLRTDALDTDLVAPGGR